MENKTLSFKETQIITAKWVAIAYGINIIIALLCGNFLLKFIGMSRGETEDTYLYVATVFTIIITIGCYITTFFATNTDVLRVLFVVSSVMMSLVVTEIYLLAHDNALNGSVYTLAKVGYNKNLAITFALVMIFALALIVKTSLVKPEKRKQEFTMQLSMGIIFCGVFAKLFIVKWIFWMCVAIVLYVMLCINLRILLLVDRESEYNYVMRHLARVINPFGMIFDMHGKTSTSTMVFR